MVAGQVRRNSHANPKVVWLVVDLSRSPATGESLANMGHRLFLHRLECGVSPLAPGLLVLVAWWVLGPIRRQPATANAATPVVLNTNDPASPKIYNISYIYLITNLTKFIQ